MLGKTKIKLVTILAAVTLAALMSSVVPAAKVEAAIETSNCTEYISGDRMLTGGVLVDETNVVIAADYVEAR